MTNEEETTTDLALIPVRPLLSPEEAAKDAQLFKALKKNLLDEDDYQRIGDKKFIRRSGFRKLSVAFGLSDEILESEKVVREDDSFYWRIVTMVTHPNGRTSVGVGICDSRERGFAHLEHDVYATAHTRSKSRATSDMMAGGAVSAEEMELSEGEGEAPSPPPTPKNTPEPDEVCALDEVTLKNGWNWDRVFEEYGPHIQTRQEQLGPLFTYEQAAVVFVREKLLVEKEEQGLPI